MADQYARYRHLCGTAGEWAASDIIIGEGEIAVELPSTVGGKPRAKAGDGTRRYSQLQYIDGINIPSVMKIKGAQDPTAAPPTVPAPTAGDAYIASVTGVANAAFGPGVTGTVRSGDMLIYIGGAQKWDVVAAHADLDAYVKKTGDTLSGDLTVNANLSVTGTTTLPNSTANGVMYANGSQVLTTGSALTFDGTTLATTGLVSATGGSFNGNINPTSGSSVEITYVSGVGYITSYNRTSSAWTDLHFRTGANTIWSASNSEQMRLTSTGLGIGTSSPAAKLDVVGEIRSDSTIKVYKTGSDSAGAGPYFYLANSTSTTQAWATQLGASGTYDFWGFIAGPGWIKHATIDSSGNLGLGVTPSAWSPGAKVIDFASPSFGMSGSGSAFMSFNAREQSSGNWFYKSNDEASLLNLTKDGAFEFSTAPSGTTGAPITFKRAMSLDATGKLSVSRTPLNFKLGVLDTSPDVVGFYRDVDVSVVGEAGTNLCLGAYSGSTLKTSASITGLLDGGGVLGKLEFNTSTPSGVTKRATLDHNGDFTAVGNVTAYSDIRLKTDLQQIPDALAKVEQLTGYTYTRTDSGERQTGLIAQDVEKVLPEAVMQGEHLSLAYGNMVGLLVEAVKELSARVKELEAR